jgi:hypothetical protein
MIAPGLGRAVLAGRFVHIAYLHRTYDSKTDQTAQSDQSVGNAEKFGAPLDQKPTSPCPKLTSGTAQWSNPEVQVSGARLQSAHAHPSDGAPQP